MSDLISRQAAIDAAEKESRVDGAYGYMDTKSIVDLLNNLPSAQPERKKGKWIEFDSSEDKYDVIKCPCCKHTFTVDSYHWTDIGFIKDDFKFCPNCGAYMRGEADGR